ncbi:MAG: alpha/beta fold hydrolase [Mycobacteriaceae bacterium]
MTSARIEHRHIEANGLTFHVAVGGPADGPPVLCLHGFPEGWMSWRPLIDALPNARVYAPDLRGYPGTMGTRHGYDVLTLTDDIRALITALGLTRPVLVGLDWGGALGWIFAHRYSDLIGQLVIVNCPHPKTLTRALLHNTDLMTFRAVGAPFLLLPRIPEWLFTTRFGRQGLRVSFLIREGQKGTMDRALVDEIVARFQKPEDIRGPINYYREMVRTQLVSSRRRQLDAIYSRPISVPVTMVWGMKDHLLPAKVALRSNQDAGCPVAWSPLDGVGHFVDLEASTKLAGELRRVLGASAVDHLRSEASG